MAKTRPAIPKAVREQVLEEFNHRCAICGADRPHLHHIDENPENNAEGNLLPLCPNHHLTDQHNPTRRIDPERLRLFRSYKDPSILSPQFEPLFFRLNKALHRVYLSDDKKLIAASDLCEFVAHMDMGGYYSNRIATLIVPDNFSVRVAMGAVVVPREKLRWCYTNPPHLLRILSQKLDDAKAQIEQLVIELLKFQNWPSENIYKNCKQ